MMMLKCVPLLRQSAFTVETLKVMQVVSRYFYLQMESVLTL